MELNNSLAANSRVLEFELLQADRFIVGPEDVVVLGHERCRMRATGHVVEVQWAHVWTFRDGLVSRAREYTDTAAWETEFAGGGS
jgi:ketosteroid isomerase-like protein